MPLEIAIPDSGPLISLGRIDRLDLLEHFNCAIMITDMVVDEVLRGLPGAPDALIFKKWFEAKANQVQTVDTTIGKMWRALSEEQRQSIGRISDAGETAIWQFSNSFKETMPSNGYGLVIFEENRVKRMDFGPNVAKTTTWSFMIALEAKGIIPSAEELHKKMVNSGRTIQKDPFEEQARRATHSDDWTNSLNHP